MAAHNTSQFDHINLADPAILQNPYRFYRQLQAESPILWSETLFGGSWLVTSYDDVSTLLRDLHHLSNARFRAIVDQLPEEKKPEFQTLLTLHSRWMVFFDPPKHTRLRRLLSRGFPTAVLENLRPYLIQLSNDLIDGFEKAGRADLIYDYARIITIYTIAQLLGVTKEYLDHFTRWTHNIAAYMGSEKYNLDLMIKAQESLTEFETYFRGVIDERRTKPKDDDLLSLLIKVEEDGDILTEEELLAQCVLMLFAGNETTKNLIGTGIYHLLRTPDQLELLRSEPSLINNTVEELLRFDSPVQFARRIVKEDFQFKGRHLKKGQVVVLLIGAANYDPQVYQEPDRLDITRKDIRPLSFGHGIHYCLGQGLARLEGQIAIGTLFRRAPHLRLSSEGIEWLGNPGFRGLKSLPVVFSD